MSKLTFSKFLSIMEDADQDINKIMADISAIDAQLAQKTQPLIARKTQLQKLLFQRQKQQVAQGGKPQQQAPGQPGQQPGQPPIQGSNQTTTPGSPGAATPGNGSPQRM